MSDHSDATDVYVSGLSHIELIGGGCARFIMYVVKTDADGNAIRETRSSIIMPLDMVPDAIQKTVKATGVGAVNMPFPTLAH